MEDILGTIELAREAAAGKHPEAHLFTSPKGRQLQMNLYRRFTKWSTTDPRTVLKVYAHVLGEQQTIEGLRRLNELASGPPSRHS